ncbi:MAG: zinc ribbon domain-containing protein [Thermoproteota archaeon]
MSMERQEVNPARSPIAGFMIGVSTSFLALLLATMLIQLFEATRSIFGLRALFEYAFIPLLVQSSLVSIYMRGRVEGFILPITSTIAGTLLFLSVMFMPSLPLTTFVTTMYNATIASLIGGVVGIALGEKEVRKVKDELSKPKICWACGSIISPDAFFCQRCGEKVR